MINVDNAVTYFSNKWQLKNVNPFTKSPGNINYVAAAFSSKYSRDTILKIILSKKGCLNEQKTLSYFNGHGCVKLLDYDIEKGGLLLEAIKPGTQLKSLFPDNDSQAVKHAAQVIKKLHKHPISNSLFGTFPTIETWLNLLNTFKNDRIPATLLQKAQTLAQKLLHSQADLYLLHGDLHYENILKKDNSWIAIDPKGVIGELAYEFGAFIRNPIPNLLEQKDPANIMLQRINQFSTIFDIEKQRLFEWSFVQSVLATCWAIQDKSDSWKYWLKIAKLHEEILEE